jgi:hypothetical protein
MGLTTSIESAWLVKKKPCVNSVPPVRPPFMCLSLPPSLPPFLSPLSLSLFRSVCLLVGPNRKFIVLLVYRNPGLCARAC